MYQNNSATELEILFRLLKRTSETEEIKEIEHKIWEIWMDSGNPRINVLMEKGCEQMANGDYTSAIVTFESVTDIEPEYSEGWNKRATAFYLRGNYKPAIDDIRRTLDIEDRHFGALSGLASIYLTIGDFKAALKVYEKLARIYPHDENFRKQMRILKNKLKPKNR